MKLIPKLLKYVFLAACAVSFVSTGATVQHQLVERRLAEAEVNITFLDGGTCSGTYVGPHTVLTAEHCITDDVKMHAPFSSDQPHRPQIVLDGDIALDGGITHLTHIEGDGKDHLLLTVDEKSPVYLKLDETASLPIGKHGMMLGHPGGRPFPQLVSMTVLDAGDMDGTVASIWDASAFPGTSGSAIVDWRGRIVGVISMANDEGTALAISLNFSPEQLKNIK